MHHTHDDVRMVAIRIPKDDHKGRGEKHYVKTTIYPVTYDENKNETLCVVTIHQGMRHQIRVHAASVGYPVVGDVLYGNKEEGELQLYSVGILSSCNS
jgi:23S rRNA-/tRNA-specific pseudouridylate synthase